MDGGFSLKLRQEHCLRRCSWHEENDHQTICNGYQSLDDENPRPTIVSSMAYFREASCKKTTKSPRQRGGTVEHADPKEQLVSTVEHGKVENHPTEQASFAKPEEESADKQAMVAFHKTSACTHDSPSYQKAWEIAVGPKILDHPIARYVHQDIWYVENRESNVELVAIQLQVGSQPIDTSISDI